MQGWECPKCGSCYAPFVSKCDRCVPCVGGQTVTVFPLTVGGEVACTCGLTSALPCRVHGQPWSYTTAPVPFTYAQAQ